MRNKVIILANNILFGFNEEIKEESQHKMREDLVKAMETGVAHFVFERKDGTFRETFGTLKSELIPSLKAQRADEMFALLEDIKHNYFGHSDLNHTKATQIVNDILAQQNKPDRAKSTTNVVFWDLEAQAFRSFSEGSLICIY